jgi:nucleoside-diphosphate-sugar epimerase
MLLVTGITGHTGRYFLQELIKNKYEGPIRCIVRESSDTKLLDNSRLNIEKAVGELTDQEFLDRAMVGVEEVIHIASVFYSTKVIKAAVKNNIKRAIFVHTTGIYSKYKSASEEYQDIERTVKQTIENNESHLQLIYLRPTMIYGYLNDRNMVIFVKMVDKLRIFPVISKGRNLLQPVNGRDLGRAYYQILLKKEIIAGDYILSGDKPISMLEMFELISDYLNKKTFFINIPIGVGVLMGRMLKLITLNRIDYVEKIQRMGEDRNFPHDAAKADFNYSPMSFKDGLKMEVEEYLASKK